MADNVYGALMAELRKGNKELLAALQTVLDQVDYTAGACGPTEMVAACLPSEVIALARTAITNARGGL